MSTPTRRGCYNRVVTIRIGGGQGFYGDGLGPVPDVLEAGVDYLVCEALAELTLAILQKDRQRDESLGFTRDLPMYIRAALPYVVDGRTRFITNAGGINPVAAGRAVVATLKEAGATGLVVATVVGDDVRPRADDLGLPTDALFANAYLGARPIVDALDAGAHVVVTGRVADASLFLAPLVHEHKWAWDDWDRLAAGVVVGHLLECSGQVAGGNYSGPWWTNPDPLRIAFPIGECEPDGSAVITKPAESGGMVTFDTVREQLLYEVHDPARYLNPDVVADFTSLTLDRPRRRPSAGERHSRAARAADLQGPRVHARGLGGRGRRSPIRGPTPRRRRVPRCGGSSSRAIAAKVPVDEWLEEYFGVNAFGGPTVDPDAASEPPEVIGRLAWRCADEATARASRAGQRRARSVGAADDQWLRSRAWWQADAAARGRRVRGGSRARRSAGARRPRDGLRSRRGVSCPPSRPDQGQTRYGPPP